MIKKLTLLAMAVGALVAFAVPAAASAAVTLTTGEETLKAPSEITAVSTNTKTTIAPGVVLECAEVNLAGETTGEGETTTGASGEGGASECKAAGNPVTITGITFSIDLETNKAQFKFTFDGLGKTNCTEETIGEGVDIDWTDTTDEIHIAGGPLKGGGEAGCPSGAQKIEGTFTVIDPNTGLPVIKHS